MKPGNNSFPFPRWQVFLEILVPCGHAVHEFLPFWKEYFLAVSDDVLAFMTINILALGCRLIVISKCLKVPAGSSVANVAFDAVFLLDLWLVEKVCQFCCCYLISERQKVNVDFVYYVILDEKQLIPITIWVDWKDLLICEISMIQFTKSLCAVSPLAHTNCCLACRGSPLIIGT
jgi:hypothetical protein